MALPFSKFPENPLNLKKFKRNSKKQNLKKLEKLNFNSKSIWIILASIFMYISIFYIFNLSPCALICTTKFWFFISNTLVLILAADFAAFSSSKKLDFYEVNVIKDTIATSSENNFVVSTYGEHVIKDTPATSSESNIVVSAYREHVIKDTPATSSESNIVVSAYREHVIKDTTTTSAESNALFSNYEEHEIKDAIATSSMNNIDVSTHEEHVIKDIDATSSEGDIIVSNEMMTWHDTRGEEEEEEENTRYCILNAIVKGNHEKKKMKRAKCMRSNSGSSAVVAAAEEERAVVLRRTSSERYDQYCEKQRMEDERNDEFSRMSNEELNTRFEEFIRRFNRQIRLQAVRRNRQNFEKN